MTHEQRPESAEFRTREAQLDEIYDATAKAVCRGRSDYPLAIYRAYLGAHIARAEARGAAEQRQKGADGAVDALWFWLDSKDGWRQILHADPSEEAQRCEAMGIVCQRFYSRPAKVAALEARVKELEGELGALLDWADGQWCPHDNTHRGGSIWTICNDCGRKWADDVKPFDPDEDFEPSAIKQARAAIREGGEHG